MELDDDDLKIIRKQKLNNCAFLKTSKKEFQGLGLGFGPAKNLVDFAKKCKEKKLRSFSSYKTKKDLVRCYASTASIAII